MWTTELAAFNGVSRRQVREAIAAARRGDLRPLRKLGLSRLPTADDIAALNRDFERVS